MHRRGSDLPEKSCHHVTIVSRVADHNAPTWLPFDSQPQKTEDHFGFDRTNEQEGKINQHQVNGVGQHMLHENMNTSEASGVSRVNVFHLF